MRFCLAKIQTDTNFRHRDVEKLRGFMGNYFIDQDIFHNHKGDYEFQYRFPKVQYKFIDNQLCIFAMEDSIEIMQESLRKLDYIQIGQDKIEIKQLNFEEYKDEFKVDTDLHQYQFETIWLALNQENYPKYRHGEIDLNKQIQNNLLSNFKGLGIKVEERIMAKGNFVEETVSLKDIKMLGFKGTFITNVNIPRYMSLGKRQSIGFGIVKKI